jgi:hypothetical protein
MTGSLWGHATVLALVAMFLAHAVRLTFEKYNEDEVGLPVFFLITILCMSVLLMVMYRSYNSMAPTVSGNLYLATAGIGITAALLLFLSTEAFLQYLRSRSAVMYRNTTDS